MRLRFPMAMSKIDAPETFPSGIRRVRAKLAMPGMRLVMAGALAVFLVLNIAIGYVVVSGALDGEWYDFRDLGIAVGQLREGIEDRCFGPSSDTCVEGTAVAYVVTMLIGGVSILSFVGVLLVILVWAERRLLARFQVRRGPNRVGPFGLLQPLADAIKMMQKETVIPRGADRFLYFLPPVMVFIPLLMLWGAVPWAPQMTFLDINVGVVYLVAVTSITTLAIFLAGWSSNNHYALLGAMRTVAMMISYEIPLSLALLAVVLMTGSLSLTEIIEWQGEHNTWFAYLMPFALFTFFFSSTAELNRTPNDIAEAESEIVAGYYTEYSGMKMGLYLAGELGYATASSAFVSALFLGGWTLFGLEEWIPPYIIMAAKISFVYFVLVWLRATLPRFRLDQLMTFAWKFLIPLSILNVFLVAIQASIFARSEVPGVIPLAIFAVINVLFFREATRRWARAIGYRPDARPKQPRLVRTVGGLRAAEALNSSSRGTR